MRSFIFSHSIFSSLFETPIDRAFFNLDMSEANPPEKKDPEKQGTSHAPDANTSK